MSKQRSKKWHWTKTSWAKKLFSLCRWMHVYLSTALFSNLLLFSVTGFTLNHAGWFTESSSSGVDRLTLSAELIQTLRREPTSSLEDVAAYVRDKTGLSDPRSVDMDLELGEISIDYPLPAGYAFATVLFDSGVVEIEYQKGSLIALLNDLHKGRHTGEVWSWVIDLSAWAVFLFSLAGLVLLLQHRKYRVGGLFTMLIGTLSPWIIFLVWVPNYGA